MRTLRQEIAYQREMGFSHSTVGLSTLLAWLGELTANEDEMQRLREQSQSLRFANSDLITVIDQMQIDIDNLVAKLPSNSAQGENNG